MPRVRFTELSMVQQHRRQREAAMEQLRNSAEITTDVTSPWLQEDAGDGVDWQV